MLDTVVRTIVIWLLRLRYRVRFNGLDAITSKGTSGILFLPNHQALIDPVILMAHLHGTFAPRAIADKDQIDRPVVRWCAKRMRVLPIPHIGTYGSTARTDIETALDASAQALCSGENILIYPAGQVYRSCLENIGANSSVERLLQRCPNSRVVLVKIHGLWGSSFSWASGQPNVGRTLIKGFFSLLACGIFFAPKREVSIEFVEPADLPRKADRTTLNRYLENFYNQKIQHNLYVPYTFWRGTTPKILAEPVAPTLQAIAGKITPTTRLAVFEYLTKLTGIKTFQDSDHLARDLGMDSLARTDLILWLEKEFGFPQSDTDALQTVGDVMLAAAGQFIYAGPAKLKPIDHRWFKDYGRRSIVVPDGKSIPEIFLKQARRFPSKVILADQTSGAKTYRQIITACLALKHEFEKVEGQYLGIMLPASVAADTFYLAATFAGKIPVMINWTTGSRNIVASLDDLGVRRIVTAQSLVSRLAIQGIDLSAVADRFIIAERLGQRINLGTKIRAFINGYLNWNELKRADIHNIAAVLFTSGSETLPKAVPLTHMNILTNLRDVVTGLDVYENDRLIGFLPPFHSFGLTATVATALCGSIQTVYHPNPMEPAVLSRIIEAYRASFLVGTPTFLNGIVRAAAADELRQLRLVVTGAEKCPDTLYAAITEKCPNAIMLEGYGVTECSPIITMNDFNAPKPFTIGKMLASLDYRLIDPETFSFVTSPGTGLLCVAGQSVFEGYINYSGASPFMNIDGKRFYCTGDIVTVGADGVFTFKGRLKRFVKLGGEMISLPAIEAVLEKHLVSDKDQGPILAVESDSGENPELVLFTIRDIDRETVNNYIRSAGLSGLHNIRRVIKLESIPVLGTGKTDYRELKKML